MKTLISTFVLALAVSCGGAPPISSQSKQAQQTPAPPSASASAGTGTGNNEITDPCWPVAPMRIVVEHRGEWEPIAEMTGDGSMYSLKRGERHFVGRVSNDAILDAHDTPSMTCIHREIDVVGAAFKGKYDEHDAYVDAHSRIAVGDDGGITLTLGNHPPQTSGRVEGVTPRTRRTAVLFVLSSLAAP